MTKDIHWGKRLVCALAIGVWGLMTACGTDGTVAETTAPIQTTQANVKYEQETLRVAEATEAAAPVEAAEAAVPVAEPRLPVGHQTIYSDSEIYGWTRYEYDELGRKSMIIFITPRGDEYWSPVFYDGNGHVIPENVGDWSQTDEKGLYLSVGTTDSRGRQQPMVEYSYDEKGNLIDYWYMYVSGKYLRHVIYQYDSQDRLVRQEVYNARSGKMLSYVTYVYNSQGYLIRMNEAEDADEVAKIEYTIYQYDEEGRLSREEKIWGGQVHDYVQYTYNEVGELLSEYHHLEDPMMGGDYTIEYLYEEIVNPEAN